jgi:hypothetical protein
MSSSPLRRNHFSHAEASSSRGSPSRQPYAEDVNSDDEADLLGEDPLNADLGAKYVASLCIRVGGLMGG